MLFGKKEERAPQTTAESKPKLEPFEIHVMPAKFHKFLAVKKRGLGRFVLILVIVFLSMAAITLGAYYYINTLQFGPKLAASLINLNQPSVLNENLNQPSVLNENLNQPEINANANENLNANLNANANLNMPANANVNENLNVNANENLNINAPVEAPVAINYNSSVDADNDKLTDVEEDLYGTEKRKPDTDEDGFTDGQELVNLYNPKAAGGSLLETSGLVNKYTNPLFNYEILHPSAWLARPTDQSLREVIFQSATGEYVEVLVEDNTEKLDLVQWYLTQSPAADLNQLTRETTKQGYDALVSPDKLTSYLADKNNLDKVYVITYNIGNKTLVNFLTTFAMMKNSFKIIAQPAALPLEEPIETPPNP